MPDDRTTAYYDAHADALAARYAEGLPPDMVDLLVFLFRDVMDGRNSIPQDGVQRALGRAPRDFTQYATHRTQFKG